MSAAADRPAGTNSADHYSLFGFRVAVETEIEPARLLLRRLYGCFLSESSEACDARVEIRQVSVQFIITDGDREVASSERLETALGMLESDLCNRVVRHRPDLVAVHGAVAVSSRKSLLITGPSDAGKSTLSLALAARGWQVGTDDIALLDRATSKLTPLPRFFHINSQSRRMLRELGLDLITTEDAAELLTPADLGTASPRAHSLDWIIYLQPGDGPEPELVEVSQATMLGLLCSESGRGSATWLDTVPVLARLIGRARCWTMTRGELSRMALHIEQLATRLSESEAETELS